MGRVQMSETARYTIVMLLAGIGVPLLATLNASLGARIGSPFVAGTVLFAVAFLSAVAVNAITGFDALVRVPEQPWHLFLAGVLVAFYVLSITLIAPRFGVGNAIFCVLLGQLVSAAVIDHFALFGARLYPMTLIRAAGLTLMTLGVLLTQRG